jgi:K+-sensing histidine kinase KdpD
MHASIAKSLSVSTATPSRAHIVGPMARHPADQPEFATSIGALGLLVFSMFLVPLRDFLGSANVAITMLLGVQVVAIIGGRQAGIAGAVVAALSFDFFFTEPYLQLVIDDRYDIITAVLLLVAGIATSELGGLRVRRELRRRSGETTSRGDPAP